MAAENLIVFDHVGLNFGTHSVHRNITFSVSAGETVTILGPSGTGKTLILKMLLGLIEPSSGKIKVLDHDFSTLDELGFAKLRQNIGMLFQGAALFDSLSVYENIVYFFRESNQVAEDELRDKVQKLLELIGLPGIGEKYPPQLSGGQKKRVGLARALASSPQILLLDEPTTGLDPTATRKIDDLIIRLNKELNMTLIAVTHDIESARRFSKRWILINGGLVVADGRADEVASQNHQVIDFINGNWQEE